MTRRGNIEAHEIAARIVHRDLIPDLILVSPAERAWSTRSTASSTPARATAAALGTPIHSRAAFASAMRCAARLPLSTEET